MIDFAVYFNVWYVISGPGSVPPSSVPSVSGGPGSVPSYAGPPSVGPHSVGASLMSPPMSGTATGVPVSTALMESKNELQEAIRKQQMQHVSRCLCKQQSFQTITSLILD